MEDLESSSFIHIGFCKKNDKIWTVEFKLNYRCENHNCKFKVREFKLISIEDDEGNLYRKDGQYTIRNFYSSKKHPDVFLNKTNMMFDNFYNSNKKKYDTFTGPVTEYHFNGNIYLQYFLNNGKLENNYSRYNEYGYLMESSYYFSGKRHGEFKYIYSYESNGDATIKLNCIFDMGKIVSWNVDYSRNYALEYINFSNASYDDKTKKFSLIDDLHIIEWTIINDNVHIDNDYDNIDTIYMQCTRVRFDYLSLNCLSSEIPLDILKKHR